MKIAANKNLFGLVTVVTILFAGAGSSWAADGAGDGAVPVTMTVTASVAPNKRMPEITRNDLTVKLGRNTLEATDWAPARNGLELFILIDDKADTRLSLQYDDLRAFINDQPQSTLIGIGYMNHESAWVAQEPTADRTLATKALRMPLGRTSGIDSPYLSVADLMRRWPVNENRREVILLTDGVGRSRFHHPWQHRPGFDPDADTAVAVAQKTGTTIFSIYSPADSRFRRSYRVALDGQMNLARVSSRTGGAAFYLGTNAPVSIQPYLKQVQNMLNNQYILSFSVKPGKKSGFQAVKLTTNVAGVDLAAHDAVWVAGGK